ncbi:MAG: citrate/2-methylcitrate synthase, partial [Planctomycetota bacterium]
MSTLKEKLAEKIPVWRDDIKSLIKEHGDKVISQVTVAQAYGGQRGVKCLVCDTSVVDPDKGVTYRGYPIGDLTDKVPEEVFYLLCTGELPDEKSRRDLQQELAAKAEVPDYVWKVLKALPGDTHPMEMLSLA